MPPRVNPSALLLRRANTGAGRIRTDNLLGASQPLSQLELRPRKKLSALQRRAGTCPPFLLRHATYAARRALPALQNWPRQELNLHACAATGFKPIASADSATGPRSAHFTRVPTRASTRSHVICATKRPGDYRHRAFACSLSAESAQARWHHPSGGNRRPSVALLNVS